ncbi:ribose-5-phosphate isomerase [Candidatus Giovannonibacteria bacterium RIFCSPLOWO2_01_FULL_43_160]|uniref:Ribose 5-phosphate isomerase rpib n=2 Tax=Candidatus Giovannoniibacteriota TaxID=1752738 RepID=A0A0G1LQ63_9BACT|nr:MAG: Ribose 5-phosphate isomerase rpib [Candidatus Giovannonibacteria bacterium GW2011_GWB1_43_13]KKS99136.1 MAG: Ribose 5-phosphate isomerase rpib [Candidatus Giovannonibacteria bacterium GW2011_GWA1_43_15]KKT21373.1 MAG: Ribose 5-phosphate isomerase rpib [Candidatus Giovannonibacteria bacterium GW2011_GWC2_43_8]KKT62044.1 MAG: Ribose 5-phosphate isomerase rpib [Candidatus Giovannonibacteria bacterium GW2011_GWA2_44_26]OGF58318.1 MAG: ribose-5-phosphate isomerase [Candidatus Giovannonibacte
MKIYIGADHAGYELKETLKKFLLELGHEVEDKGAFKYEPEDDYPDFILPVARAVANDPEASRGIIFGGSGQGEAMCANRVKGARASVFYGGNFEIIELSRKHNDANILSLGARFIDDEIAKKAVELWLKTSYEGGRHERRIAKMDR